MSPRDILLALVVIVAWGLNFIAIKWGVGVVPPLLLTALRYVCAAVPLVFFVKRPPVPLKLLIAYGVFAGALQFGMLYVAISIGMPAGLSSLLIQMQAFFTIGFAMLFLGETPGRYQVFGAAIALAGILVIASERLAGAALLPLVLTLAAAACWGFGNILTKRAGKIDMLAFIVWSSLVPPIPLFLVSLLIDGPAADLHALTHLTWGAVGTVLFMSYAATICGYGLWSWLLSRYPASTVAPFSLLVPVVGIGASLLLLGEPVDLLEGLGSLVIFLGLIVNVFGTRWQRRRLALKPPAAA
jgi:O-acetylserine/cysteine efflux transporter